MGLKRLVTLLAVSAVAAFGVAACGDDEDDNDTNAAEETSTTAAETGEASVSFVTPEDGATVGDPVTVEVALEGFELDAANVGKANVEGAGHLHFSIDGGKFDDSQYSGPNGKLAEQLGTDGQYSPATEPTITYEGLPPGQHTLVVDLVNNDHSETGVSESVTFTAE